MGGKDNKVEANYFYKKSGKHSRIKKIFAVLRVEGMNNENLVGFYG